MRYLDRKGMRLSQIALGTGRFGSVMEKSLCFELMDIFYQYGGNLLDTARNYYEWIPDGRGKSEATIGEWMERRHVRNNVIVCTKGGVRNEGKRFVPNLSKENLIEEIKESLDALRTDYIDIYLLHRDEISREVEEIGDNLIAIADECHSSLIGVSNWRLDRIMKLSNYLSKNGSKLGVIQTWWSIADYTPKMWNDGTTTYMDYDTYKYLMTKNIICMAYTSQAKGFFQKAVKQGLDNIDDTLKKRIVTAENLQRLKKIKDYCNKNYVEPTEVVNAYITQNSLPGIALVSCSTREQLIDIMVNCDKNNVDREWLSQFNPKGKER